MSRRRAYCWRRSNNCVSSVRWAKDSWSEGHGFTPPSPFWECIFLHIYTKYGTKKTKKQVHFRTNLMKSFKNLQWLSDKILTKINPWNPSFSVNSFSFFWARSWLEQYGAYTSNRSFWRKSKNRKVILNQRLLVRALKLNEILRVYYEKISVKPQVFYVMTR